MSISYPIHHVPRMVDGVQVVYGGTPQTDPCGTTGVLVLMEQTNRPADGNTLFCLRCLESVTASEKEHAQAAEAARSEGWKPPAPRVAPMTTGDMDELTRAQLRGLLRLETMPPCPPGDPQEHHVKSWHGQRSGFENAACEPKASGHALGYVEGHGLSALTAKGREMALLVLDPEVPAAVVERKHGPEFVADYAARAKMPKAKKARAVKPALPMVCVCTHSASEHTTRFATEVGCGVRGCACDRYRQQRPVPVVKTKRVRKQATV